MIKEKIVRKTGIILVIFLLIQGFSIVHSQGNNKENIVIKSMDFSEGYTDITCTDAYDMLNNLNDGIQIPIDVRTQSEYFSERINTSFPEDPRNHCICGWGDQNVLNEFISEYQGCEIVLYCYSGSRSAQAAQMLVDNGFDGTIYNMLGGISGWKSNGFPTITQNKIPDIPVISGPVECIIGDSYTYYAEAYDPDCEAIRYGWDFNNDQVVDFWTDYYRSGEQINITHIWDEKGTKFVKVISEDRVGDRSISWASLEIEVVHYDQVKPVVDITKPAGFIYFRNKELLSIPNAIVIGDIDIEVVSSDDSSGVDYVELFIDDEKVFNSTDPDFEYLWDESGFGRYEIKTICYDKAGNNDKDRITLWKFF